MVTTARPMTAEELLNLPDDGFRYELIRGKLRKRLPAGQTHGKYASKLNISLGGYVMANRLGETYIADTGYVLATDPDHVLAPDLAFISNDRLSEIGESDGFAQGAPDVAVEVISPNDRYTDVEEKVEDWLNAGCGAVIIVNPRRRTVNLHRSPTDMTTLTESDTLELDDIVPGWRMPVEDIFE
ncbi:MAG: Uma2 family endonuclease [Dehalococcoidia bacterium]|nr:Uma2 family endonuclease [Dehalococcoidia bacterium]